VDGSGVPLSIIVTGAHRHDVSQLERVLDAIVIERPKGWQHLCADKGYSGEPAQQAIKERKYIPHVKQRGQEIHEKKTHPRLKARRCVVEVTHSWFNRFRKILVRYEKFTETYRALLHMAAAMIAFRKAGVSHDLRQSRRLDNV
jgi:putative transposase